MIARKIDWHLWRKKVAEGELYPRGYRPVYWCCDISCRRTGVVVYPIGIHWIARLVYRLYLATFNVRRTALERLLSKTYECGRLAALAGQFKADLDKRNAQIIELLTLILRSLSTTTDKRRVEAELRRFYSELNPASSPETSGAAQREPP